MFVKCLDNKGFEKHLKVGQVYKATNTFEFRGIKHFAILDSLKRHAGYEAHRFEVVAVGNLLTDVVASPFGRKKLKV